MCVGYKRSFARRFSVKGEDVQYYLLRITTHVRVMENTSMLHICINKSELYVSAERWMFI